MTKRLLISMAAAASFAAQAQTVLYTDDFESYAAGALIAETNGTNWSTWTNAPGGTEDAPITEAYALSGTKSIAVVSTDAALGGPVDLLLKLGDRTTGVYTVNFSMYIPAGMGGYFNVQHHEDATPAQYAIDVTFLADGSVHVDAGDTATIGTYVPGEWFNVSLAVDLDNETAALLVGANPPYLWASNTSNNVTTLNNQLGSIDFFAFGGGADLGEYYVDDVNYVQLGGIGLNEWIADQARVFPNPVRDLLTVSLTGRLSNQATVELLSATGQAVAVPVKITGQGVSLSMRDVADGVYFLRITDGERRLLERVVKN